MGEARKDISGIGKADGVVWIARCCQTIGNQMPATTLVPGYKQVDSFGPDEEYVDEEEEVSYVTLDLGVVEPTLLPSTSTYRLIGLDTPTPFLQLSGSIFKGRHDMLLGTELLFTEEKNDTHPNKRCLAHVGSTEQRIRFKEVQLKEKARTEPMPSEPKSPVLLEHVASIYADVDSEKAASQAPVSGPSEQPSSKGETDSGSSRKKKNRSRKGKERAVDVNEEDAMDTI
ncbi:hypothetical protein L210DRAFT_3514180 [Boletus edulis BED1]|uniref:Transcription factor TFIIIC triple barrel domain-containing protein n=1 Tax=Boletus edulis BED1 TaxID=1328754 RepID=A0AAD4C7R9_BOLED|nr:hypothetical protein L210DRAFT_3514180 [Boletus edulis BED1]